MTKKDIFNIDGKVCLVTGASRGIGESIARLLAQYGAHVIVSSRVLETCQKVADSIVADGGSAEARTCDVGSIDDIKKTFADIEASHGRLDILVNNAGVNASISHILDTTLEGYEQTVNVNIRGYLFMSIEAGKLMREQGGGVIVNTASVNGIRPPLMQGVYSMTKAAVINLTKAFARECGPFGIRCNALLPGLTKTEMTDGIFENEKIYDIVLRSIPMGRHAEPDEMAGTVLYLVSDASSYTTGECIVVDGGMII